MALFRKPSNRQKQSMARQANVPAPAQINMIGEGTVFEGTLRAKSDVRVSGRIIGKLIVEGKAILAQEGAVEGELTATSADVAGRIEGEIHVKERLLLKGSARIDGNVSTARLVIEEGAMFNGECKMGRLEEGRAASLKQNGASAVPSRNAESKDAR
jgi:cytoskeletal protein CcmA (bactofilin family)